MWLEQTLFECDHLHLGVTKLHILKEILRKGIPFDKWCKEKQVSEWPRHRYLVGSYGCLLKLFSWNAVFVSTQEDMIIEV